MEKIKSITEQLLETTPDFSPRRVNYRRIITSYMCTTHEGKRKYCILNKPSEDYGCGNYDPATGACKEVTLT